MISFIVAIKYRDVNLHFCLFRYFEREKNLNERKEEDEKNGFELDYNLYEPSVHTCNVL